MSKIKYILLRLEDWLLIFDENFRISTAYKLDRMKFPKNLKAVCLLTDAPSQVATEQLDELGITLKK